MGMVYPSTCALWHVRSTSTSRCIHLLFCGCVCLFYVFPVTRAVGMMYLVDLDDTPGYTITLSSPETPHSPASGGGGDSVATVVSTSRPSSVVAAATSTVDMVAETEKILAEARAKLDALTAGSRVSKCGCVGLCPELPCPADETVAATQSNPYAVAMFMAQSDTAQASRRDLSDV